MDAFVTFFESFRVWMFDVLRWIFRIWLVGKYVLEKFLPRKHISGAATLCTKLNSMSQRSEEELKIWGKGGVGGWKVFQIINNDVNYASFAQQQKKVENFMKN